MLRRDGSWNAQRALHSQMSAQIPSGCMSNMNVRHAYMCSGPDDLTSCPPNTACKPGLLRDGFFTCQ